MVKLRRSVTFGFLPEQFDILFHAGCNRLIAPAKELIPRLETVAPNNSDSRKIDTRRVNIGGARFAGSFSRQGNLFYRSHLFIKYHEF